LLLLNFLFLEEILKGLTGIVRPQAGGSGRFFLSGHANLKQLALVSRVLFRDPFLYRLHALKPASRIEIRALLARMQFKSTLRTLSARRHSLQDRAALRAS
jgi:hypothetical protein